MASAPQIFVVTPEPQYPQTCMQFAAVTDARVVWIEAEPALFGGWKFKSTHTQDGDAWAGMSAASIIAYKQASGYPFEPAKPHQVEIIKRWAAERGISLG